MTTTGLKPIRRPRVSDEVASRLSEAIRSGVYQPGDYLPSERDLMKTFGVGRPAIREGLLSLRRMGLVSVHSGTRSQVSKPDGQHILSGLSEIVRHVLDHDDGIRQFQDLRILFEVALVRDAAIRASARDLRTLKQVLDQHRDVLGQGEKSIRTDIDFHFVFAERTKNPMIVQIHDAMVEWLRDQRRRHAQRAWFGAGFVSRTRGDLRGGGRTRRGQSGKVDAQPSRRCCAQLLAGAATQKLTGHLRGRKFSHESRDHRGWDFRRHDRLFPLPQRLSGYSYRARSRTCRIRRASAMAGCLVARRWIPGHSLVFR